MDTFSCGCVLAELCSGDPLFLPSESVVERVKALERVIEPFPLRLAQRAGARFPSLFDIRGASVRVIAPRRCARDMQRMQRIEQRVHLKVIGVTNHAFAHPNIAAYATGTVGKP